jgi:dihydropteroate synthase
MEEAIIAGILNVTPDSFSNDGCFDMPDKALCRAHQIWEEGASYVDVGGESTRPGFIPVDAASEWKRIASVVKTLVKENIPVSVDTRKKELIPWALAAGVSMINFQGSISDIWDFIASSDILAEDVRWVLMYNGRTDEEAEGQNLSQRDRRWVFFDRCSKELASRNIAVERIIFDLGIGFGTSEEESIQLLRQHGDFVQRYPQCWMLATSRKSFMKRWCREAKPELRLATSLATAIMAYGQGCRYFRVHDVRQHRECLQAVREIYG